MALVVAGAVAEADGDGRAAAGLRRGGEVGRVVVPVEAEGVDHVEPERGGTLDGEARHFCGGGIAVAKPEKMEVEHCLILVTRIMTHDSHFSGIDSALQPRQQPATNQLTSRRRRPRRTASPARASLPCARTRGATPMRPPAPTTRPR